MGGRGSNFREGAIKGLRGASGGGGASESTAQGAGGGGGADTRDDLSKAYFNDKFEITSYNQKAQSAMRKLFGKEVTATEVGRLVGAYDGMKISVKANRDGSVTITGKHPFLEKQDGFTRSFAKDNKGKLYAYNESFFFKSGNTRVAPEGLGGRVFDNQRQALQQAGVQYIKTFALRNDSPARPAIGYRFWADIGYNAKLSEPLRTVWTQSNPLESIRGISAPKTIQELYGRTGGREFWKRRGESTVMIFDLKRGSDSNKVADAYFKARGVNTQRPPLATTPTPTSGRGTRTASTRTRSQSRSRRRTNEA